MLRWLEMIAGSLLTLAILLDVFLTVLYARIGTGFISHRLGHWVWRFICMISDRLPRRYRADFLSFGGPTLLVVVVAVWVFGLFLGAALVTHPNLGRTVTATTGETPTDFATAFYVAGDTMTTVGTSDLAPRTSAFRTFYVLNSLIGLVVITLTITYLLEIYTALNRRNTFTLKVHLATDETGDAAELLAGLGPHGEFQAGYSHLAEMSAEMIQLKESHHFYSALMYFRFAEPHYALSRLALMTLDMVSLIKSALDDERYAWLKESAGVAQLWRATMRMLTMLSVSFLPQGMPEGQPDPESVERWRRRYFAAVRRLREAGIATLPDESRGAETYVALRARWDRYIRAFAEHMRNDMDAIDPVGTNPEIADERRQFQARLRSAG